MPTERITVASIAAEYNVQRECVTRWARKAGVPMARGSMGASFTEEQKALIVAQRCEYWRGGIKIRDQASL